MRNKILSLLALLLTAVTGAWADEPKVYDSGDVELFSLQVGDILMPGVTLTNSNVNNFAYANIISNRYSIDGVISPLGGNSISSNPFSIGENGLLTAELAGNGPYNCMPITEDGKAGNAWVVTEIAAPEPDYKIILIGGTTYPASSDPNAIDVKWDAATKTGTFQMPAFDVEIAPIYAPAAKWDVVENVDQLPAAIEGIIAGQDEAIVTAGQSAQGTVMYAVTTTAEAAPALTAFSATVPTAKDYDDATTLYVWYYIQGQDTPQGQQATEENTFNDSEICAEPITVTVLSNKFDIQFNAANANTIEAGKATVTVGGTAATVTEGKLQGVKMGSEVKMTAKEGYKFRKVEVKKGSASKSLITNPVVGQVIGSDGKNYAADATLPDGVIAVAKVCYVDGNGHGLALALSDEGYMNWSSAQTACAAHTPAITGGTWKLATKDEWNLMINAAGSYTALRDGFTSVGGAIMEIGGYWSSTENGSSDAWYYTFFDDLGWSSDNKNFGFNIRACLAF